jgi:hypothetical protein
MRLATSLGLSAIMAAGLQVAQARITNIEITRSESPTFEGRSFDAVGQYEKLVGRVTGEIDPADQHNSIITDIKLAPHNAHGNVEYETARSRSAGSTPRPGCARPAIVACPGLVGSSR